MPTGTSAGMVTLNWLICVFEGFCFESGFGAGFLGSGGGGGGGMIGSALIPGRLNFNVCGSLSAVLDNVTSTVVPALAPQGDRTNNFGLGKLFPAGCCPWTVPVNGDNAPITASIMSNGLGPLAKNEKARRMDSSFIDDPRRENI